MERKTNLSTRAGTCLSQPLMEELEQRIVLSGFSWTSEEVYLAELVNRARANPSAEAIRVGLDLTAGLSVAELARYGPSEPLALNAFLTQAARDHALDMAQRGFFDHVNPDGDDPTDRALGAGYTGVAGENIAAGYTNVDDAHYGWLQSLGHRLSVLSLHDNFNDSFHYDEIGVGFVFTDIEPYYNFFAQSFGFDGPNPSTYILGVVFGDTDADDFYSIGEGAGQVFIDISPVGDPSNIVGSYTTDAAGNYQIVAAPGTYRVQFTDLLTGGRYEQNVTIGDENVKTDARLNQFVIATDDHAATDDLPNATNISLSAGTGAGSASGIISTFADGDLFRFDAVSVGQITIEISTTGGSLDTAGLLFDQRGLPLAFSVSGTAGSTATVTFSVVTGQTYYLAVTSFGGDTIGDYSVSITGRPSGSGAHPGDGVSPSLADAISAVANANDQYTAVVVDAGGLPMVFERDGSGWSAVSLLDVAGGATAVAEAASFVDPVTGLFNVASPTAEGLMLYTRSDAGVWSVRNLTAEDPSSVLIVDQLTVLQGVDGVAHLAGLSSAGSLIIYSQIAGTGNTPLYAMGDIAQDHLVAQGLSMPTFVGDIISYVTEWNGLNIVGLDSAGQIQSIWWAPGMDMWRADNLSAITGAPAYAGGLTAYLTGWGGINIAGVDLNGDISVTWWVPDFGGDWIVSNLTSAFGGPQLQADSLTSFVTPWGGLNIVGLDSTGQVTTYWWVPSFGGEWVVSPLIIAGVSLPVGDLSSLASPGGVLNIFGTDASGDLTRYYWDPAGLDLWFGENISEMAGV